MSVGKGKVSVGTHIGVFIRSFNWSAIQDETSLAKKSGLKETHSAAWAFEWNANHSQEMNSMAHITWHVNYLKGRRSIRLSRMKLLLSQRVRLCDIHGFKPRMNLALQNTYLFFFLFKESVYALRDKLVYIKLHIFC